MAFQTKPPDAEGSGRRRTTLHYQVQHNNLMGSSIRPPPSNKILQEHRGYIKQMWVGSRSGHTHSRWICKKCSCQDTSGFGKTHTKKAKN
ncbi:hypothetical protein ACS0TY_023428 [Phlomoides rotata]